MLKSAYVDASKNGQGVAADRVIFDVCERAILASGLRGISRDTVALPTNHNCVSQAMINIDDKVWDR